ncbi:hypothetical protein ACLM5H_16175 [Fredinandcohnia humi]
MKRLRRICFSLLAIVVLLVTNPGSLAYAWGSWNTNPGWKGPSWDTPPTWETTPTWETVPSWEIPPEWNQHPWQIQPEWGENPWVTPPVWNQDPANPTGGNGTNPNGPTVNPNNPSQNGPGQNPGDNTSTPSDNTQTGPTDNVNDNDKSQDGSKQDSGNSEPTTSDSPFFNFKDIDQKGAIEYISKDILGGTVSLIGKTANGGEITPKDFLTYKGNIFYAGFKGFTKGDQTVDFIYDSADVATKSVDLYKQVSTFNDFRQIQNLQKSGDILAAAAKYDELVQAGKTFTPANAIVSAIAMPFTIIDTVDNVGKFNAAKTSEEKTAAGMDLVGNAGSIISGAAAGVALIPGAQPIAAGMLVVGTALSLVSLGHKIYRNRTKIVKDVKEKFSKAKKAVTGFFKSIFGG